jgi:sec-independent protein translocase protein TatC
MILAMMNVEPIFTWLTHPFEVALEVTGVEGGLAIVTTPFEGVYTYLKVGVFGGLVLALPVVVYQVWLFVAPGLYKTEQQVVYPLALASTVLFILGAAFCYYVMFPVAFPFFLEAVDARASLSLSGYLSTVVKMMLAFGICFQLPVGVFFLARMGLVDHHDMRRGFRYAVVSLFMLAALITPPEVLTQVLLAVPLVILYVLSIGVAWVATTKVREQDT